MTEGQRHYIKTFFVWIMVLQGAMLFYLAYGVNGVCNSFSAWPLEIAVYPAVTALATIGLFFFSWRELKIKSAWQEAIPLGVLTAVGASHTLERISSGCVLDYWPLWPTEVFMNLGDVSLFLGVLALGLWYFWDSKR